MGFGQRLMTLRKSKSERKSKAEDVSGKVAWELPESQNEVSTDGEGSFESLGSLELGGGNFPVNITEYINHSACYITIDSTRHCSRIVSHEETQIVTETVLMNETVMVNETVMANETVVEREASIFEKTLKSRERMAEVCNPKTSVDCVLDEVVLTLERDNIFPELSYLTRPMIGRWETDLLTSDPLDPLFKACGINYVKRFVVDKLPLQIDLSYSDDNKYFQLELQIPFGTRVMKWDLHGETFQDNDPDCGLWDGHVNIVKLDLKNICPESSKAAATLHQTISELPDKYDTEIYAPTQIRTHATIGIVHESRFSLPSKEHGRLLFLKYELFPKKGGKTITVMRCLKAVKSE